MCSLNALALMVGTRLFRLQPTQSRALPGTLAGVGTAFLSVPAWQAWVIARHNPLQSSYRLLYPSSCAGHNYEI